MNIFIHQENPVAKKDTNLIERKEMHTQMKHRAHQLITVWTKYTLSITRLRRYTKIMV